MNDKNNTCPLQSDRTFLVTEPIGKLLAKLALPTIAAQMINMLYNIVDRIYIGHIPDTGAMALTGVGVCMPLIMIITAFAALVGNGGAPRATIFMGNKLSVREADDTPYPWQKHGIKGSVHPSVSGTRFCDLYYAGQREYYIGML